MSALLTILCYGLAAAAIAPAIAAESYEARATWFLIAGLWYGLAKWRGRHFG
jgi:hypothetical protein